MTKQIQDASKKDVAVKKELTPAEKALFTAHAERMQSRHATPTVKLEHKAGKPIELEYGGENATVTALAIRDAFGTTSPAFKTNNMDMLINAVCSGGHTAPIKELEVNGMLAAMHGIAPRDETEAMLAMQMVAVHTAAMRSMRLLKGSDNIQQQDSNGNLAVKLMRTYTMQLEALNRYRGKAQQKVVVEHVHVHAGAQAIVGNVTKGGGDN